MKINKDKKSNKKFDLEKMKVAKLKNVHLIIGGGIIEDPKTGTGTSSNCDTNTATALI